MMIWISLLTRAPWVVIGPGMLFMFRWLALREVRTFLHNVAAINETS